ncbi:uncharacterized protein LOC110160832 [Boleophthalmus pectinirostris]|uniref:uncharacterized protein LOC110160832 n=1 Tax=Boleophthalmus pectinirostris TaxID=150288 RepID=UPI00242EFC51|nr:uncharacterized protein LOC110160832 [Boleophthalmus pectinirostris]
MALWIVWLFQIIGSSASENSSDGAMVWRVSVPEHHLLCLPCGPSLENNQDFSWTHGVQEVPPHPRDQDPDQNQDQNQDQDQDQDQDHWRFSVRSNGTLCLLSLRTSDSGVYFCNGELRAQLQVLSGEVFCVRVGWTLLLPCSSSFIKSRQRWSWRKSQSGSQSGSRSRWEPVLSRSKGGAVVLERPDPRLGFEHGALSISSVQVHDAGEYRCNSQRLGTVQVLPEMGPTSSSPHSSSAPSRGTDFAEEKRKEKTPENVFLMGVVCLSLMVLLTSSVCVFLLAVKCRRKRRRRKEKQSPESTELHPWTTALKPDEESEPECPSPEEEAEDGIHYASLGRPTWKHRPAPTTGGSQEHRVIYSTICTK